MYPPSPPFSYRQNITLNSHPLNRKPILNAPIMALDSDLEITRLRLLEQMDDPEFPDLLLDDSSSTPLIDSQSLLFPSNESFKLRENEESLTLKHANVAVCTPDTKNPTGIKDLSLNATPPASFHVYIGNIASKLTADEIVELITTSWPELQGSPICDD